MDIQLIKDMLKEKNMNYIDLAEKSGISLNTIRKILAGITLNPRVDTVQAIYEALGLNEPVTLDNFPISYEEFELMFKGHEDRLDKIANLSPDQQKILFDTIDAMIKSMENK